MSTSTVICATCGVERSEPVDICPICADERQYMPQDGVQRWTTLEELRPGRKVVIQEMEPGMYAITSDPEVGIGQRSILVQTPAGNLMWDVIGFIDDAAIARIHELGGIRWIAASHPHMYGVQQEWAAAFPGSKVLISARDREWLGRDSDVTEYWDGVKELTDGLSLIRVGGHFAGSGVVHWQGNDNKGVLLSSDSIFPVPDAGWLTFLRSYPNRVPLSATVVRRIADQVTALPFDRLYGNFVSYPILSDANGAVRRSADRHIAWVSGEFDDLT